MRYENWDVLLFPEDSRTPIQEFRTQCFVTRDRDSPYLRRPPIVSPSVYGFPHGNYGQLPVLTSFIPSLPHNTPFRVSVHSWEKPRPSRFMESLMEPDDTLCYEIRVFIDGLCVSASIVGSRSYWPHVIDYSSRIDKNGNQDHLRFPPFHQEILEQRHWEAGELYGRIRIVISEGFSRSHSSPPFERVKDAIAFSFQHAPLDILEYSSIAWPNPAMWSLTTSDSLFKYNSGSGYSDYKESEGVHTHSPTRHEPRASAKVNSHPSSQVMYNPWAFKNFPAPPTAWQTHPGEQGWPLQELFAKESFMDPYAFEQQGHERDHPSLDDISMPDYTGSSASSSRAISSMTGVSYEHSKQPSIMGPLDQEHYNQLVEALQPSTYHAQASAAHAMPTAMTTSLKPSAAAEARSASYTPGGRRASASSVLREISQPGTRNISGSSSRSGMEPATTTRKVHASPSGQVQGKKEAMNLEDKENEADDDTPRKGDDKTGGTALKTVSRVGVSVDTPKASRRVRSTGSILGDLTHEIDQVPNKDELSLNSPLKAPTPVVIDEGH